MFRDVLIIRCKVRIPLRYRVKISTRKQSSLFNLCLKLLLFTEIIVNINVNTKDYSYQFAAPKTPVAPRPLLVAVWETRCLETVDIMMELGADTSVLFSSEPDKEKPKPLFFHVRSTSNDFSASSLHI